MNASALRGLTSAEVAALRRLGHRSGRAASSSPGRHATGRLARSGAFESHVPYLPGDDLKRVDWKAAARTGRWLTRLGPVERGGLVRLWVDASASMTTRLAPPNLLSKSELAIRLALYLGSWRLFTGDRVEVAAFAGLENGQWLSSPALLPRHPGDLARMLDELPVPDRIFEIPEMRSGGEIALFSDFAADLAALASRLERWQVRHPLRLCQIQDSEERRGPPPRPLRDAETGKRRGRLSQEELKQWRSNVEGHRQSLLTLCRHHRWTYRIYETQAPVLAAFLAQESR